MITILSPAKNLNFKQPTVIETSTLPIFQHQAELLIQKLKALSKNQIQDLMNVSPKLAELNYHRYQVWSARPLPEQTRQAILAFNGEVYNGLRANDLKHDDLMYAQKHVRILSGLYGVLRPLDLIQPYRLEMGIPFKAGRNKNLYEYWGDSIHQHLADALLEQNEQVIINLASSEYARAARLDALKCKVISPVFKELRGDEYKFVTVYFKKARGLMTRFILQSQIDTPEDVKHFDWEGYNYNNQLSNANEWVFTR